MSFIPLFLLMPLPTAENRVFTGCNTFWRWRLNALSRRSSLITWFDFMFCFIYLCVLPQCTNHLILERIRPLFLILLLLFWLFFLEKLINFFLSFFIFQLLSCWNLKSRGQSWIPKAIVFCCMHTAVNGWIHYRLMIIF